MSKRLLPLALAVASGACDDSGSETVATTLPPVLSTTTVAVAPVAAPPTTLPLTTVPAIDVGLFIDGSEWMLDAFIMGADAAEAVPREMRDPTISFEGGTALVDAGCNTGSVRYTTSGDLITFEGLDLTDNSCGGAADGVERQFVQALSGTATVVLDNGILFLVLDDQQLVFFPGLSRLFGLGFATAGPAAPASG